MRLTRCSVRDLRIIAAAEFEPGPHLNLVIGPNASGKTSLLEALYLLGRGRGLRQRHGERLIREGCERLRVTAELVAEGGRRRPIGVERGPDGLQMRLDGRTLRSALELSTALPLQYLHPDIHQLVLAGPGLRRQFLDRGVFHVEPRFLASWRRYQRALRQRNAALKSGGPIDAWDGELAEQGQQLDTQRRDYLAGVEPRLRKHVSRLLGRDDVGLVYRRGWNASQPLAAVLRDSRESDRRHGFTGRGAHRCDFALTLGETPIRDRVSRGQQKLLLCALQLAQAEWQRELTGSAGLLLVDDLPAELDARHRTGLLESLAALEAQVFVTATDRALVEQAVDRAKLFHVEHGELT